MPKQKTHKGLTKRVRITKTGKIKYKHVGVGHLLSGKPMKRKRKLRRVAVMAATEQPKFRRLLAGKKP